MAHMIQTKGGLVTVHSERDMVDVIEAQMGHEFATFMSNYLDAWDYEAMLAKELAKEKARTDEEAVMEENDSLRSELLEVIAMLEQWQVMIEDSKRLDKNKLYSQMANLEKQIHGML